MRCAKTLEAQGANGVFGRLEVAAVATPILSVVGFYPIERLFLRVLKAAALLRDRRGSRLRLIRFA
jgi:hypothetical protein